MNADYPILQTDRLVLRKFHREEAMIVRELAGNPDVAHGCIHIPHPYGIGIAEMWIACHETWYAEGSQLIFAITRKTDQWIIGTVSLTIDSEHALADIGYWIGAPFWYYGYATEAARAVIAYGFGSMGLHKIIASHFLRNRASGRVLEKLGMHQEGLLRSHLLKGGVFEDVAVRGILVKEWKSQIHTRNSPSENEI
ncbi:MAG: GNAT family N-acetyltransferase [Methanospirillum sp.]|uniref:GNAT family N-acetyltransferase n=1 Tax=Methanospirillum sp. TaxID=45200 RepID=UPI0023757FA2|nr:GNAT family N-acetyltransferase [Methanospirillum sp.]MDD1728965.1 GNAT family N-acetyltransferase [Methanospirillum sp.]